MSEDVAGNKPSETPARRGRDVFISYSRHDKETADAVCAALERAGISCWIGPRDTQAGAYGRSIMEAIRSARMLVLILSPEADGTPNVLTEVAEAFDRKLPLLPFRLSNFPASDQMRFYIRTQHWIDAFPGSLETHLTALVARITEVIGAPAAPQPSPPEPPRAREPMGAGEKSPMPDGADAAITAPARERRGARRRMLYVLPAAILAAGAALLVFRPWEPVEPKKRVYADRVSGEPEFAGASCLVADCWGAVAFGPGGAWAYAVNYASRATASNAAQKRCGNRCTKVLTFHNSCGAYASGTSGYGWGTANDRSGAETNALAQCRTKTDACIVRVWGCTSR